MAHHTSHHVVSGRLQAAKKHAIVGGRYYHWKNPHKIYTVLAVGVWEPDERVCVIYTSEDEISWIRPLDGEGGWLTPVEHHGKKIPRFIPEK